MDAVHPMMVHVPIGLVLVWPWVDLAGRLLGKTDVSRTAVALLAIAVPASLAATVTGQFAYDAAIAAGFKPETLDTHADAPGLLPLQLLLLLGLLTLGVKKWGAPAHGLAILLGFALIVFVVSLGGSGGQLVFEHGVGVRARS